MPTYEHNTSSSTKSVIVFIRKHHPFDFNKIHKKGSFRVNLFPTPALSGSGYMGIISARYLGHPLADSLPTVCKDTYFI